MKVNEFLSILKTDSYQNASAIFFNDREYIFNINNWLNYIFNFINSKQTWYYSVNNEEYNNLQTPQKEFTLDFPIQDIFLVEVDWKEFQLVKTEKQNRDNNSNTFRIIWENQIRLSTEVKNLFIDYKRFPKKVGVVAIDEDLDIPEALVWVLYLYAMSRIMMPQPDWWQNISIWYINQADAWLDNYVASIWHLARMNEFSDS